MSQKTWQRLVLTLTIAFGSLSLLLVVVGVVRLLPRAMTDAADVLPAEQTLFLIENANLETLESWRAWMALPPPPKDSSGATLALLAMGDERAWIMMREDLTRDPPFVITAPNPAAAALVRSGRNRLGSTPAFVALRNERTPGTWAWWNSSLLQDSTLLPSPLIDNLRAGSIARHGDETTIAVLPRQAPVASREAMPDVPESDLSIGLQEPARVLAVLRETLPPETTLPAEGLLRHRLQSAWGERVSMTGDIGPLLHHPAVFTLERSNSGTAMTLKGTGDADLETRLSDLFARAHVGGVPAIVDRRIIEGFTIDEVRQGTDALRDETVEQGGWTAWIRSQGPGRALCAARRYDAYVLSNDREACLAAMSRSRESAAISAGVIPVAVGHIDPPLLAELRTLELPGLLGIILRELPDRGAVWTVTRKGDIFHMQIMPLPF